MKTAMTVAVITTALVVSLIALFFSTSQAFAGGEVFLRAAQDFKASVGHAGVGVAVNTTAPGFYLRATGEVGGVAANNTGLDYLYEGAGGWAFKKQGFLLTPYVFAGYRQWAVYDVPVSTLLTSYAGAGFSADLGPVYLTAQSSYYSHDARWQPYVEVAAKLDANLFGVYYEVSPVNGPVLGVRYGITIN